MNVVTDASAFEPLPLKRRALEMVDTNQYCVWSRSGETREIKANTAYEAFRSSGLTSIIKIERLFNTAKNILDKSKFAMDDAAEADLAMPVPVKHESLHERIRTNRNPIISADELDELMQAARAEAQAEEEKLSAKAQNEAIPAVVVPTQEVAQQAADSNAIDYVPPPVPTSNDIPEFADAAHPTGLDVHGDGFDEIIPAAPTIKAPIAKPPEPKETLKAALSSESGQSAPATPAVPEQELSKEEVERLLSGK